ncbi:MAG TPA: hypothetical protein VEO19_00230 [Terriglobia bacterium]|nr:hypothetical protein [Terriglobia bacterium]
MAWKTKWMLVLLCLLGASCRSARADEFSQVSHYAVRMFSYGLLTIDTRVGDIHIEGWDEPRLEIEAEKVVRARSSEAANPLYEQLAVVLEGKDKHVQLRTLYPPRKVWRPFRGEAHLSVNYHIKMPFDANLALKCVDGDVWIRGVVGKQVVLVNYGDVEIDVPSLDHLRSLRAHAWLGYVQSDLHGEDRGGFDPGISYWNPTGEQDIYVKVRMGGVFVFRDE